MYSHIEGWKGGDRMLTWWECAVEKGGEGVPVLEGATRDAI